MPLGPCVFDNSFVEKEKFVKCCGIKLIVNGIFWCMGAIEFWGTVLKWNPLVYGRHEIPMGSMTLLLRI